VETRHPPQVNGFTFNDALDLAVGVFDPQRESATAEVLADFMDTKRLTFNQQRMVADLIRMLPPYLQRGRPRGAKGKKTSPGLQLEFELARQVVFEQKRWCKGNVTRSGTPCKIVPVEVTKEIIGKKIAADLRWQHISVDNVLRHLKNKARLS
jgi:hypothetical protein